MAPQTNATENPQSSPLGLSQTRIRALESKYLENLDKSVYTSPTEEYSSNFSVQRSLSGPGFIPPTIGTVAILEDRIARLRVALHFKKNERQFKNIQGSIKDLEEKGTAALLYQGGVPTSLTGKLDMSKGPIWANVGGKF
ncbi:hypothetical protein TWF225_008765 [Orbilia oligospora]|nr:hypothetical protein TWF225_008765 [Orbilia oligospora]KAF3236195.1 hypothetical protein TWF217_002786 [Orbilia oligospora]KAF3259296.1 hypothetical protein TWF128_004368 [Orbilia oligospora]